MQALPQSLKLLATAHEIELKKTGYASYKTTVTPRPGIAQVVETDLGEWIVQLARETPSHLILPAIHKPRAQIQ